MTRPPQHYTAVFEGAVQEGRLKRVTRDNYVARLSALERTTGKSVDHLLRVAVRAIEEHAGKGAQTVKSYLTAFLALFRHQPLLRASADGQALRSAFKVEFDRHDKDIQAHYDSNVPTVRQARAYMPWAEVLSRRDAIADKTSQEYLLLCLYTMVPPLRADFGNVRVLTAEPTDAELQEMARQEQDYMVVTSSAIRLVLNQFKSKSSRVPQYSKVLPPQLKAVVRAFLAAHGGAAGRRALLLSPRTHQPFTRDNSYVVYVHRVLQRVLGKNVSISMLRRIYVTSLDLNALTSGEKDAIAADMLHSPQMHDRYRLLM